MVKQGYYLARPSDALRICQLQNRWTDVWDNAYDSRALTAYTSVRAWFERRFFTTLPTQNFHGCHEWYVNTTSFQHYHSSSAVHIQELLRQLWIRPLWQPHIHLHGWSALFLTSVHRSFTFGCQEYFHRRSMVPTKSALATSTLLFANKLNNDWPVLDTEASIILRTSRVDAFETSCAI